MITFKYPYMWRSFSEDREVQEWLEENKIEYSGTLQSFLKFKNGEDLLALKLKFDL